MLGRRIGMLALAASACGFALAPAWAGDITFWTWRQEDKTAYTKLFNEFTKANPSIHVKFEAFPSENYQTIVSTALAAGHGPDVIHTRAYGALEVFAKAGYLVPLDAKNMPELKNLEPDALASETLRSNGKVYSLSFAMQTLGILINKDIFAKAGLQPPQTWAELLSVGHALKAKGIIPIANGTATGWMDEVFAGDLMGPMLGRQWVSDVVAGRTNFSDPRYVAGLTKLLELRDLMPDGYTGIDYPTSQQLFLTGRAAMFVGGSFEIANFRAQNPKLNFDFIAPPAPAAGDPRPVSTYFDGGYAVNAKSADQADALKLVRWMGTPDFGNQMSALLGNVSPLKGVTSKDPLVNKVMRLDKVAMPYIMLTYFRYETPTGSELIQNGLQKMFSGNETPKQLGAELTTGIARYYVPFQKK